MDAATACLFAQYRAWADTLTYDAVSALPQGEAEKPRPTLFKTIIGTLNHNYLIDRIWQAHLEGRDATTASPRATSSSTRSCRRSSRPSRR